MHLGPGIGTFSTTRKGDKKLIYCYIDKSFVLFNVKEDMGEANNVVEQDKEKVKM